MSNTSVNKAVHSEQIEKIDTQQGTEPYNSGDESHEENIPMTWTRALSFLAMALLWTGSQIPVYLLGAVPPYIYGELGGTDKWVWFILANLLALASICPFVGSLSDILGRRWVAMIGACFLVIGMILCGTAHSMENFIAGMTLSGVGAGINELTAISAVAEMSSVRNRGRNTGFLIMTIIPFVPSVLYGQCIAFYASWRWCAWISLSFAAVGGILTFFFYHPPPRVNSEGLTKMEIAKRIDYVGGLLSISGLLMLMAGFQWGGYQYKWKSAHVIAPLAIGVVLLVTFCFWEIYGAKYPMFPSGLKKNPRILAMTLIITFISGTNFFAVLMFWPVQAFNVYGHNPVGVGIRGLPIGISILAGAVLVLFLLTALGGYNRELIIASSVIMTAGAGSLSVADRDNLPLVIGLLIITGLGIGGIILPASIITTIVCPDELIATVTALTLSIRVLGGAIGYTAYFNVFINKFIPNAIKQVGGTMYAYNITDPALIGEAVLLTANSLIDRLHDIPGIDNDEIWSAVVLAGQIAYADSYVWVYYTSIAFGAVSIIAACFMQNINHLINDRVAVVIK